MTALKAVNALNPRPQCGYSTSDLAAYLEGRWQLTRRVEERHTGLVGLVDGTVIFQRSGEGLVYREWGVLRLRGAEYRISRTYRYTFPTPASALVWFADGAPFHDLDLSTGYWMAEHRCGQDWYQGKFNALEQSLLTVIWTVQGPNKDHTYLSRYRRKLSDPELPRDADP